MHERALPCTSVSSWNCVLRQANINQPDYPTTHVTVTYLVCVVFLLGRTSYTQRTRNDEFLGLRLFAIWMHDCVYARLHGRNVLQSLAWSALFSRISTRFL